MAQAQPLAQDTTLLSGLVCVSGPPLAGSAVFPVTVVQFATTQVPATTVPAAQAGIGPALQPCPEAGLVAGLQSVSNPVEHVGAPVVPVLTPHWLDEHVPGIQVPGKPPHASPVVHVPFAWHVKTLFVV